MFARRFFYKWNRWVHYCGLKGLGIHNCGDSISGEQNFLKRTISDHKNPVLFDIGANKGDWTRMALAANPSSRIFAFEPNPAPYHQLSKISGIKTFNCACGDVEGKAMIFDRADSTCCSHSSLDREVISIIDKGIVEREVNVVTLDRIISSEKVTHIDVLKIDVEGFEYEVLEGAKEALRSGIIKTIQFEFNTMNVIRHRFFRDFKALLPDFVFYRLLPNGKIPLRSYDPALHEIFAYQNLVACLKK